MKYANELASGARRIYQRPEDVENGSDTHLRARAGSSFGRRMMGGGIHEPHPYRIDTLSDLLGSKAQVHSKGCQHVRRAAFAGNSSVTMFRNRDSACGDDEGCRGRDVERIARISAGSTGVQN